MLDIAPNEADCFLCLVRTHRARNDDKDPGEMGETKKGGREQGVLPSLRDKCCVRTGERADPTGIRPFPWQQE